MAHADRYSPAFSAEMYEKIQNGEVPEKDMWRYSSFWYKNFDEMPVMLSVNQAAEVLGISNVSLYKLIEKDKSFPVVQLGRRKSIPKEQLKEWIDEKSKR